MKHIVIILSSFLFTVSLVATETPLIHVDKSRIEAVAIKAIIAKQPDLKPSDLALSAVRYSSGSDVESGSIEVLVSLPATGKSTLSKQSTMTDKHTHYDGFDVTLTNEGAVLFVSKADVENTEHLTPNEQR